MFNNNIHFTGNIDGILFDIEVMQKWTYTYEHKYFLSRRQQLMCVMFRRLPYAGAGRRGETTRSRVREILLQLCDTEGVAWWYGLSPATQNSDFPL